MSNKITEKETLRAEAEARVAQNQINLVNPQPGEELLHKLLHELRVHQVQLEIQNEALRQMQLTMEESRDRYVDLYDFAPIGYLTVSRDGMIVEINLTGANLLGVVRSKLVNRRFAQFVAAEDRDRWYAHFASAMKHDQRQQCELTFLHDDGSHFRARVDSLRAAVAHAQTTYPQVTEDEVFSLRLALTDIPAQPQEQ